jgi:putative holliday junction resolvase
VRTLGVDYGAVRTGLALSDPFGVTCRPLEIVVERDESALIAHILQRAAAEDVAEIVIGLPRPLSGGTNVQLERAQSFLLALAATTRLPVHGWDERFTSKLAAQSRAATARPPRKGVRERPQPTDDVAACHLLQNYLDARAHVKAAT